MIAKPNKNEIRQKRHLRIRARLNGSTSRPRLCVYRSSGNIYAQIIDDVQGKTLAAYSSITKGADFSGKNKTQTAEEVGKMIAQIALKNGIESVVFDRGGYLYTGRVKALAEGARAAGLKF